MFDDTGCLGREAVLRVRRGFPIEDARQRVPTFEFFHSLRGTDSIRSRDLFTPSECIVLDFIITVTLSVRGELVEPRTQGWDFDRLPSTPSGRMGTLS